MAVHYNTGELSNELVIRITDRKRADIPVVIFLMFWLAGWACGEGFALYMLFNRVTPLMIKAFLVVWVLPWTVGGVFAFFSMIKMMGGHELIRVGRGMLEITKSFIVLKINNRYDIFKVRDLHAHSKDIRKFIIFNSGLIKFTYEDKTVRFGSGLSTGERTELLEAFRSHPDFGEQNFQ